MRCPSLLGIGLALGCTVGPPDTLDGFGDAPAPADESSSTSGAGPDVAGPDVATDEDEPCAKVDLLFVIDNSASMADEQANLVASFPGFITGIESILPRTDYHVGVVTTDDNEFNASDCRRLGALTVATGGNASSDDHCGPYSGGHHFMTAADDLASNFACAAQVGIDGSGFERPLDAIAAALDPADAGLGACNTSFLRDDALLVLVLITDEEDDGDSHGDPADWFANVVAAKDGAEENIVVLSLVGHAKPNACIDAQWDGMDGAEISPRLVEFTESFTFGKVGDVCAASYDEFFLGAIVGIADACRVVVPVN